VFELALSHRLPGMYETTDLAEAGGLMAYGPNIPDLYRRAAGYVARILAGADPAELPVGTPERFDLAVNLKTAGELGITVPPEVLAQATEVIR
jgi:putative tryptophan/tyrosine transport system substrate-binding protein